MKSVRRARKGNTRLIVFCNGWGMDLYPFSHMDEGSYDLICLFDYRRLVLPDGFERVFHDYESSLLIGWSMGVWAAQQLFARFESCFARKIAVNGTLQPISDIHGIPVELYTATMNNWSPERRQRFYRRMCREKGVLRAFLPLQPQRQTADQREELEILFSLVHKHLCCNPSFYTDVVVSDNDLVMPTVNQQRFWKPYRRIIDCAGCHFPFFRWRSWDDFLEFVNRHG